MATTILGAGTFGSSVTWQIDYDGVSTVGCTATGTATDLILTLTVISSQQTYNLDVTQYMNQGRVVLAGPGSVLGFTTAVPPSAIPAPAPKGQTQPYVISAQWTAVPKPSIAGAAIDDEGRFVEPVARAIEAASRALDEHNVPAGVAANLDVALDALYSAVLVGVFSA